MYKTYKISSYEGISIYSKITAGGTNRYSHETPAVLTSVWENSGKSQGIQQNNREKPADQFAHNDRNKESFAHFNRERAYEGPAGQPQRLDQSNLINALKPAQQGSLPG